MTERIQKEIPFLMESRKLLSEDLASIDLGNLNTLERDLTLPSAGKNGSAFTWVSGEERFLTSQGHVCRPLYGMGNRDVSLTVTARLNGITDRRTFSGTVLQEAKETVIDRIFPVKRTVSPGENADLPPVAIARCRDGRLITVPVEWERGAALKDGSGVWKISGVVSGTEEKARAELTVSGSGTESASAPKQKGDYLPVNRIRLLPGSIYWKRQQDMMDFLLQADTGQMLYSFRAAAGLDTEGAVPMTGWDAPSSHLRGHTTGHFLSGLALAFAASGNPAFLRKIDEMVRELGRCQSAMEKQEGCHPGFLSAYSEEPFDLLEAYVKYPDIWAPYYTLEKIMSGLYDCHVLAGNKQAKQILMRMGDWVCDRLSRLPRQKLDRMWSLYIAGEYGGMPGVMVKLYRLSGEERYLRGAGYFLNEKLFYPMEENCDTLEDMHANQHIPQIMGAMELYRQTGRERYWKIGKNFWDIVTGHHTYCIGGVGENELFHGKDTACSYLTENTAESCASYNLLRLTGQLFPYLLDKTLMDYYETTLCNHILASCSPAKDGGTTYFMPLCPGGKKEYTTSENTCCHGTGMESRFRYMEHIFFQDPEVLYLNLLIPCTLADGPAESAASRTVLELVQEEEGVFRIRCRKDMEKRLAIRIPAWAGETYIFSGADAHSARGYLFLEKPLKAGETFLLSLPMELHLTPDRTDKRFCFLTYGPYILAAKSESRTFLPAPRPSDLHSLKEPLHFSDGELEYLPLWQVDQEAFHVYFCNIRTNAAT